MVQLARVTYSLPGRRRVKIHEKRGDEAYFTAPKKDLANCLDIFMIEANHLTSTVRIRDKVDDPDFLSCALERNLFRLDQNLPVSHPLPPAVPVSTHRLGDRGQHRNP